MGRIERGVFPDQTVGGQVEFFQGGAGLSEWKKRRADVMSEAGEGECFGPNGSTGASIGFDDQGGETGISQDIGGDEAIGAGSDDDDVG